MKVGLRIPGAGPWAGPEAIETVSRRAEGLGFDSLWMTDHLALPVRTETRYPYRPDGRFLWAPETPYLETLTALTWAAAATERITIGTSVLVVPWRPLVQTAKTLVSIDVLSRGRLVVGVGAGWMREQFDVLGASFADRGPRLTEAIRVLKHIWRDDELDFSGTYHDLHGFKLYPKPVRPEGIPIWCGGYARGALRRTAAVGDGWHPLALDPEEYRAHLATLTSLLEQHGRTPDDITLSARPLTKMPYTPETLEAYAALGVTHFVCDTSFEHASLDAALEEIDALATELLPAARALPDHAGVPAAERG